MKRQASDLRLSQLRQPRDDLIGQLFPEHADEREALVCHVLCRIIGKHPALRGHNMAQQHPRGDDFTNLTAEIADQIVKLRVLDPQFQPAQVNTSHTNVNMSIIKLGS
jgi:hypothetical protein